MIGSRIQSPGDTLFSGYQVMAVGSSNPGRNFNGDIAEVLLYNRDLGATERAFVDAYLGTRYALPGAVTPQGPQLHTNFSIDAGGETLVLTRPDGTLQDLVAPVAVPLDASHGLAPESGNLRGFFATPTPGQPNAAESYGPPVAKPVLSEPCGFKEAPFNLAITHPDPAVTLVYTLDGSEPSTTNGTPYTGPLAIASTTVVRAAGFKTGALPQRLVSSHSFFFLGDIIGQTTAPAGYPATWGNFAQTSYAISPTVAALPGYAATLRTALASCPTLSISMPVADLFGSGGIYANPLVRDVEKVASAEWITPDGSLDVQIDAAFSASYFGGVREDYDAMTHRGVRDGDNVAWNAMRALAQAGLAPPAQYAAIQQYLDVDGFIDYMILNIYGGNTDWPNNNWNATRKREAGAGYRFFAWDAERTPEDPNSNRVALTGSNNPAEFYAALRANAEFRLRFADRVRRHFFNGGALTPAAAAARYAERATRVQAGVFGEEARWGAYRDEIYDRNGPSPRYRLDPHWLAECQRLLNNYFPVGTATVLAQFKAGNLYPAVDAPTFSQHGGQLVAGQTVTLSAPAGTIYHTTDGSDPRVAVTGAVSPAAVAYTSPLALAGQPVLKARALAGGVWSALTEAAFFTVPPESEFKPAGSGDWTLNTNWTPAPYPNGPGKRALIRAPLAADRNLNLLAPVTIGSIRFDESANLFRNRVRDQLAGNTLTFDGGPGDGLIQIDGGGSGFVESEVLAGVVLAGDLEVRVNHLAGNPEHGALRLRAPWSGPGGLRKTGAGVASLNGEDKDFTGDLEIHEGVLQLSEPATPALVPSISVQPGGQLRLVSGSSPGLPRTHGFTVPIALAGHGRGPAIPDDAGQGKLGALRYDPGNGSNHAIVPVPLELSAAASVHVDGSLNRLELTAPLAPSLHPLTKSGGGTLHLNAGNAGFTAPVQVANGTLELAGPLGSPLVLGSSATLAGHGSSGPISGSGTIRLDGKILAAPSLGGTTLSAVLNPKLFRGTRHLHAFHSQSLGPDEPGTRRIENPAAPAGSPPPPEAPFSSG